MIKDLNGVLFEIGNENSSYARYFVGQSYLNMLSTEGVSIGNVTFEPAEPIGIFIMVEDKFF